MATLSKECHNCVLPVMSPSRSSGITISGGGGGGGGGGQIHIISVYCTEIVISRDMQNPFFIFPGV